jgi:16S rRNA (guanine527-N7)-methyltransferase
MPKGIITAYKGKKEKIEEEQSALPDPRWELLPCPVPFLDEERHLVVVRDSTLGNNRA